MPTLLRLFILVCTLLSLTACSYLSQKFESMAEQKHTMTTHTGLTNKKNYCPQKSKIQYISEDEHSLKFYRTLHPGLFENKSLNFIQKVIMISLLEMSRRPDKASPYSRFQIYLKFNGKAYYYDFRPRDLSSLQAMPFLRALEYLAQNFLAQKNLLPIALQLEQVINSGVNVSSDFEEFLFANRKELLKNEELATRFLKGDESLTKYETFKRVSYQKVIQYFLANASKKEDYEFNLNPLIPIKTKKDNIEINCNYDLHQENSAIESELNLNQELVKSHSIAFSEGENFFLAVSFADLKRPLQTNPKLEYLMTAHSPKNPLPICEFKNKNQEIVLFSSEGRSPLQHLQHLEAYEIEQIDSSLALSELLTFSRHLFLTNPERILYESKRGRKAQLDFFLEMNFPIYHVEGLGNIFGHAYFKNSANSNESSLFSDNRGPAKLWCKE